VNALRRAAAVVLSAGILFPSVALGAALTSSSKTLTIYRSCALTAYPSSSTTDIDAYVDQALNSNQGTATTLSVESAASLNRRTYLKFDLTKCNPAIASAANVKLATLRLYVTALPLSCRTLDIFAVTASWTETNIKWSNQPFGQTINNPASGSRTDSLQVGASPCTNSTANQYVTGWNVTADVAKFVAGTSTNFGWMIRDDGEGSATAQIATFSAREAAAVAQAPQLIVTYTT